MLEWLWNAIDKTLENRELNNAEKKFSKNVRLIKRTISIAVHGVFYDSRIDFKRPQAGMMKVSMYGIQKHGHLDFIYKLKHMLEACLDVYIHWNKVDGADVFEIYQVIPKYFDDELIEI